MHYRAIYAEALANLLGLSFKIFIINFFRYDVHPKLSSFMTPIEKGSLSDISRNDLFSSLFGGRYSNMS